MESRDTRPRDGKIRRVHIIIVCAHYLCQPRDSCAPGNTLRHGRRWRRRRAVSAPPVPPPADPLISRILPAALRARRALCRSFFVPPHPLPFLLRCLCRLSRLFCFLSCLQASSCGTASRTHTTTVALYCTQPFLLAAAGVLPLLILSLSLSTQPHRALSSHRRLLAALCTLHAVLFPSAHSQAARACVPPADSRVRCARPVRSRTAHPPKGSMERSPPPVDVVCQFIAAACR